MNDLMLQPRNQLVLEGRRYPFTQENATIPAIFQKMKTDFLGRVNFQKTKDWIFHDYHKAMEALDRLDRGLYEVLFQAERRADPKAPFVEFSPMRSAVPLSADLWAAPQQQMVSGVYGCLEQAIDGLITGTLRRMDWMVQNHQLGLLQWLCNDACRYWWYICETASATRRLNDTQAEVNTTYTKRVHVHDLVQAKCEWLPKDTPAPQDGQLNIFWHSAVAELRPYLTYVTGVLLREITAEHSWQEKQVVPSYKWDPCISLGHYVLYGWK